ncbi:MAG: thymidine phosphorylase [Acidobacteriota bacterium]|nr:thymidine phosphorylase [Acidobacteriota bacterium]
MRAVDIIRTKRDGGQLSTDAIECFVNGASSGAWPDYQTSALLMAIVLRGMASDETADLTRAMVASGERVDLSALPGVKVGKHSTGGVGDKVSIALVPLVAACGVTVPKMSGRGLGHTGGTLDKLESIPGFRTALSLDEFRAALADVGCAIIGQTASIVPADKVLYALRDVTATIESVPLIASSVMSKKIAEGSDTLVLDVKCGRGAFMKTPAAAAELARVLVAIGTASGVRTEAAISRMDAPLGRAVGNALEIRECLALLSGRGPSDLADLVVALGACMVRMAGLASTDEEADTKVRWALASGAARDRFGRMVARQGGDARIVDDESLLPWAPSRTIVTATRAGIVQAIDAERVGRAAMRLGAGRDRADAPIDHAAGVVLAVSCGDRVGAGEPLMELHHNDVPTLDEARALATEAVTIADVATPAPPLIIEWVRA